MKRLAAALALLALTSCARSQLVILPQNQLPQSLYQPSGEVASPRQTTVVLYMVEGTRLAAVQRTGRSTQPLPQLAMTELLNGPTRDEISQGLTTQIPGTVRVLDLSIDRGTATVDLSRDFELSAERTAFLLRLAQVVWTLTELDNVDSVRFSVEGEPVSVMVQDGTLVSEPVGKGRYSQYAPRSLGAPVDVAPISGN